MNWLFKLIYEGAGPTRSTREESEESWKFVRPLAVWCFWLLLLGCVIALCRWIGPWAQQLTERDLLWIIIALLLWRR